MKTLLISDLHIDRSEKHNGYVDEFIDWVCEFNTDQLIQLGDFYDKNTNVTTPALSLGKSVTRRISTHFERSFFLVGNHGLYYSGNRNIHAMEQLDGLYQNVVVVNDPIAVDDSLLCPWICSNEEFDMVVDKSKDFDYIFGHFEFAKFRMNQSYKMKHGFTHKAFSHARRVVSGHYHSEQEKDNVFYCGVPIALDFTNKNEFDHGIYILDHETNEMKLYPYTERKIWFVEGDIEFVSGLELTEDCTVNVIIPEGIDDAELTKFCDTMEGIDTQLNFSDKKIDTSNVEVDDTVEDIDSVVSNSLKGIDVDGIDNELLVDIWNKSDADV